MQAQLFTADICSGNLGSSIYGSMYSTATANSTNIIAVVYKSSNLTLLPGQTLTNTNFRRTNASGKKEGSHNFKIYLKKMLSTILEKVI